METRRWGAASAVPRIKQEFRKRVTRNPDYKFSLCPSLRVVRGGVQRNEEGGEWFALADRLSLNRKRDCSRGRQRTAPNVTMRHLVIAPRVTYARKTGSLLTEGPVRNPSEQANRRGREPSVPRRFACNKTRLGAPGLWPLPFGPSFRAFLRKIDGGIKGSNSRNFYRSILIESKCGS